VGGLESCSERRSGDIRLRSALLASTVIVLVVVGYPAAAKPATLLSAFAIEGHVGASWSLPSGVESSVVEVATSSSQGTDGSFFTESLVLFDVLFATQTSYVSTEVLPPGTYYLHVGTYDPSCAYVTCPGREYTQTGTFTIPNESPQITGKRFGLQVYAFGAWAKLRFKMCDDSEGYMRIQVRERRTISGRVVAQRRFREESYIIPRTCTDENVSHWLPDRLLGDGRLRIAVRLIDPAGATSPWTQRSWAAPH
jgi:hypothetical protein